MTIVTSLPDPKAMRMFSAVSFVERGSIATMTKKLDCDEGTWLPSYFKLSPNAVSEFLGNLISHLQLKLPGVDVTSEIISTLEQGLGAVLYFVDVTRGMLPVAFAIVHHGRNTAVVSGTAHVKFLFADDEAAFSQALAGVECYAHDHCLLHIEAGVQTANARAFNILQRLAYKVAATSSCMVRVDDGIGNSLSYGVPFLDSEDIFLCADFKCSM